MRIDKLTSIYETYNRGSLSKVKTGVKIGKKDELSLSKSAKDFQIARKALANVPEVREAKIQDIKERIQSGNYTIDAKEVADKMLSSFNVKG